MQYLVECADKSLCVIYERSIVVENVNVSLSIGETIRFLWPEDSPKAKHYSGLIMAKDREEDTLMDLMESLKNKQSGKKRGKAANHGTNKILNPESEDLGLPATSRKRPPTLIEMSILDELKDAQIPEAQEEYHWVLNEVETLKRSITSDLNSFKDKIFAKLDLFTTNLLKDQRSVLPNPMGTSLETIQPTDAKRRRCRSYGMPADTVSDLDENNSPEISASNDEDDQRIYLSLEDGSVILQSEKEDVLRTNQKHHEQTGNKSYIISSSSTDGDDDDDDDFRALDPPSSNQIEDQTISLPSTHDGLEHNVDQTDTNENTAWTLRFPTEQENVVEIIKGAKIYANRLELKTATGKCRNENELARALLRMIFNEQALKTCSLMGKKAHGRGKSEIVRPGLNKEGVEAILLYVQGHAKKLSWPPKERQLIIRSMACKLGEMKMSALLNK